MSVAIVPGSAGLVGSDAVRFLAECGMDVVGIDNNMREDFFGPDASTEWNRQVLESQVSSYRHLQLDIRDETAINKTFRDHGRDIVLVIHAAAQPSHDWAARDPVADFSVNATGTLLLLEATRRHAPDAVLVLTSQNQVVVGSPIRMSFPALYVR